MTNDRAASRGRPSYVWGFGQERRLELVRRQITFEGDVVLDIGCGIGTYMTRFRELGADVAGLDVDLQRVRQARESGQNVAVGTAERLPFETASFDVVLLNEVLEHVADDRLAIREVARVLAPGGQAVVFVPNRWWPFETHGIVWRGRYRFGNIPLVNYLPDPLRNRLAPHVRVYTTSALRRLLEGLPLRCTLHTQVFPGYDKLVWKRPRIGELVRRGSYFLEHTPLRKLGLSHLMIVERLDR